MPFIASISIACAIAFGAGVAPAALPEGAPRAPVIRILHPVVEEALRSASSRSTTLRAILDELRGSDLIVHVMGAGQIPGGTHVGVSAQGAMHLVGVAGGRRFVRITVDDSLEGGPLASIVAHELYHALEVARAPHVIDSASLRALYETTGEATCREPGRECYDTARARAAGLQVLEELLRADWPRGAVREPAGAGRLSGAPARRR